MIVFVAILAALLAHDQETDEDKANNNVKIIGLAINYTLMVPIYMNWVVKLLTDMEKYMDSIRRIERDVSVGEQTPQTVTIGE